MVLSVRRAFSLIELLVVVAIVSMLIAILLPTLSAAREQARTTLCLSNLRQVAHGWHVYADENHDISVPARYAGASGGMGNPANWYEVGNGLKFRPRWIVTMGKYSGLFAYDHPRTDDDRQDYTGKIYHDPAAPEWVDERNHAWGYNYQFLGNSRMSNGQYINYPVNRTRIKSFAGTVLGADSLGTAAGFAANERSDYENQGSDEASVGNHAWSLDPPRLTAVSDRGSGDAGSRRTAVDPRHRGLVNAVFCDGHAQSLKLEALGYRRLPTGAFVDLEAVQDAPVNTLFSGTGLDDDPPAK